MIAFYDLAIAPVSYDFVTFMVAAKTIAQREHLDVFFVPGPNRGFKAQTVKPIEHDEMVFRLHHLVIPMVHLFGATHGLLKQRPTSLPRGYYYPPGEGGPLAPNFGHTMGNCFKPQRSKYVAQARPWPKPTIRARELAERDFPGEPFVITLRETYTEGRNSLQDDWLEFARYARDAGEDVVVVRDTSMAMVPWHDFRTAPLASFDVDYRLALYHRAKMNFTVSGGPPMLMFYSDLPYRVFKMESDSWKFSTRRYLEMINLPPGSQPVWATGEQKIVWEDDTFDVLKREFDEWRQHAIDR